MPRLERSTDQYTLIGLDAMRKQFIGKRGLPVNTVTIRRWIKYHGFPASKLPDGRWITTFGLIDTWILARNRVQLGHGDATD